MLMTAGRRKFVEFVTEHGRYKLHARKLADREFALQLAVAQNRDSVAHLIHLFKEVRYEDYARALRFELVHDGEQVRDFMIVERTGRLVEDEHFAVEVYSACYGHHLLDGDGIFPERSCHVDI